MILLKIIISEKAIAGRRIAAILAGKNVALETEHKAQIFNFIKGGDNYALIPLKGHIVDIDFPKMYSYWSGTDLMKLINAEINYEGMEKNIIKLIKEKVKEAEEIIIATDSDREGEAIGMEALRYAVESNPKIKVKRAYFSAITPKDINNAFNKLHEVDYNLADSADSRREIDLIWGAVLTRFFSLISGRLGKEFLSVGRVQTPVLAMIVEREKERMAFESKKYWVLDATFLKKKEEFTAEHKEGRFWEKEKAEQALSKKEKQGKIKNINKSKRRLSKPAPFNTTSFLRSASALGVTTSEAMDIAESLYMEGYISYPRTDNTVYPETIDLKEILNNLASSPEFADDVSKLLKQEKIEASKGAKETKDHPPIHPVTAAPKKKLSDRQWKLYELVVRRFFATLSEEAETDNVSVEIDLNGEPFTAKGQILTKKGWKEFYPYSVTNEVILPELIEGELVDLKSLNMNEKETQPPSRYSQGTLIKIMEDNMLGTKSTRPAIIQKLYQRQYISGLKAIEPNKVSFSLIDSIEKHKGMLENPELTAALEKEMDEVAAGKKKKEQVVNDSRKTLEKILEKLIKNKNEIGTHIREALRSDSVLTECNACKEGHLRMLKGKTGKRFVGCTNYPKCINSFPLPQQGKIVPLETKCETCSAPKIKVFGKRFSYEMCLDPKCETKKDWGKKKEEKEKQEAAEAKGKP